MGKTDVAATFDKRAANWRNAWDPKTGFMRARLADGTFREPFDPTAAGYGSDFTEGNAWQYSWYVPQDVAGLIAAMGGDAAFIDKLDQLFDAKVDPTHFKNVEDITGLIGWYAHGNEPSHHIAYLYDYAGAPWKTQQRLKQIMDSQYARASRWPGRQRRPRPDVGLVRVHRAGLLPGDAGQRRIRDRPSVRGAGRAASADTASASP